MTDPQTRIEQFRKMAEADPQNELGHFSLGRAYMDAEDFEAAAVSLRRAIELAPALTRAYQLLATALLKCNRRDEATRTLLDGLKVAHERGDFMPKKEIMTMLGDLGVEVPEYARQQQELKVGEGEVHCKRCNQVRPRMPKAPFKNAQGQQIWENVCAACWREWIGMGTKVINELRLPLSDPQAQKIYDAHMLEFLNLK